MKRYDFYISAAAGSIIPLIFFAVTIIDINGFVKSETPSPESILRTILDFAGGGLTGFIVAMLFFIPAVLVTSEHTGVSKAAWELIRYRTRDTYTVTVIRQLLAYIVLFTVITEIMKITVLIIFVDADILISAGAVKYAALDFMSGIIVYYRALILYNIIKTITAQKASGLIGTIAICFTEYVLYAYILYQSPACPCHILTIPFRVIIEEVSLLSGSVYILLSIFADSAMTLWFLAGVRRKDVIACEG